ncbi:MAG: hypothetical protein WA900_13480, partial [Casimicrobiaceae bacterium]
MTSTDYLRGRLGVLSEFPPSPAYEPRGLWRDLAGALRAKAGGAGALLGWSVDYVYAAGRLIATTKPPAGAWHTIALTVTGDLACTAWFSTDPQVTVTTTGSGGGTVTSAPGGISCPGTCTAAYAPGIQVTLTATP